MQPLDDVRVVSLAINLPGPVAAALLRDLGARVTKIEPPTGDMMAMSQPDWYRELTEGIEVLSLNLKESPDRAKLDVLLAEADLLLTSFRPSALDRLGLGWSQLHPRFPRLCQVAIVGYPGAGRELAGHDLTYQASVGMVVPPSLPRSLVADLGGAERAALAALALLRTRDRGGGAGYSEVALSDAADFFAQPFRYGLTVPGGGLGGGLPGYGLYPTKEGWIAVAALEPHFLANLEQQLGIRSATRDSLSSAFAEKTAFEWEDWATERGLPMVAVRDANPA